MKKLFFVSLFLFSYVVLYSAENVLTTFLEYIFDSSSFRYETNDMGDAELLFAYRYKTPFGIFDKAIVMYQDNNSFHPILYINNDKLINADGRIIFEDLSSTKDFYGWTMQIFEQDNLFSLTFYSNNGKNVTDGPIMEWDNKSKIFKRLVPDRSQW